MRQRPFAVEKTRRDGARSPREVWRTLVSSALLQARRASGEIFGVSPDGGESERWALMEFGRTAAHAPPPPLEAHDHGAQLAVEIFQRAAKGFCAAGTDGRRRLFAPMLQAAAEALDRLLDEPALAQAERNRRIQGERE